MNSFKISNKRNQMKLNCLKPLIEMITFNVALICSRSLYVHRVQCSTIPRSTCTLDQSHIPTDHWFLPHLLLLHVWLQDGDASRLSSRNGTIYPIPGYVPKVRESGRYFNFQIIVQSISNFQCLTAKNWSSLFGISLFV